MTSHPLIVLCDDTLENAQGWQRELADLDGIAGQFELEVVEKEQFERDVERLERRRVALRRENEPDLTDTVFDRARILIVDYDLFEYKPDQLLTGDSIAYLARTYSDCGFIVGVNQDRITNPFDASLIAHRHAATDLSIGADQIPNPGLWSADPGDWDIFRPWSWPVLPRRAAQLESLAKDLEGSLDVTVSEVTKLAPETLSALPRPVAGLLEVPGERDTASIALRDWVSRSQMGVRPGDRAAGDSQLARIAAARLSKWFDAVLLPGQDVLVDAPHLVERRPGLLAGPTSDPGSWHQTTRVGVAAGEVGLDSDRIASKEFDGRWLSRPAWRWDQIASDQELDELRTADRPDPVLVFAEDCSRFVSSETARRFSAGVEAPFRSRWLFVPDSGQQYLPASAVIGE